MKFGKNNRGSWKCIVDAWNSDLPADPLLAEWTLRYETYQKSITGVDLDAWEAYLSEDCVWVKPDGAVVDRANTLREFAPLFKAKSITGGEKVHNVNKNGDLYEVTYTEAWTVKFSKDNVVKIKNAGTDVWKKNGGKWQIVKTIDQPTEGK